MILNVLIVGVGGQGILTTSNVIARASLLQNLNVVTAETHGMAQRGGSVEVHLRIGDVKSPMIPYGSADFVISLEMSEVLRYSEYIGEKTTVLLNTKKIVPPTVSTGVSKYPELDEVVERLSGMCKRVITVNASEIAEKSGNVQAANVVMAGMLAALDFPVKIESMEKALEEMFSGKVLEVNKRALWMGYEAIKSL